MANEINKIMANEIMNFEPVQIVQQDKQYESQVDIAKRYPRNLKRVIDNSIVIATMDKATAEICNYNLPVAGKKIAGASVHLARIIVQQYGNIRVESRVTGTDRTQVHAEAICFDLETNVAVKSETSKSIMDRNGRRYKEHLIITTGKAAAAIAFRNAVFSVVPKGVVDKVYKAAMDTITGDLSDETKLIQRRTKAIEAFENEFGVAESELLKSLGLNTVNQIKQNEIVTLIGMYNAIKLGEVSINDMFEREEKKQKVEKPNLKEEVLIGIIKQLEDYDISLKSALQKAKKEYELNPEQTALIKEAGEITPPKVAEIAEMIEAGTKNIEEFKFILSEQQMTDLKEFVK